jgi:hypothetical protein
VSSSLLRKASRGLWYGGLVIASYGDETKDMDIFKTATFVDFHWTEEIGKELEI